MEYQNKHFLQLLSFFLLFLSCWLNNIPKTQAHLSNQTSSSAPKKKKASAIFVFGDSTVDPGNNNYLATVVKSNFLPYGRDFVDQKPTGRFSNGRLSTDFIASYVGVKEYVPPYLDPTLSMDELMSGVSFASAGTGYDPLTSELSSVIPVSKEIEYFKEYKRRIESKIGKQQTEEHINKAIFVISAGTNDFVVNYFSTPFRRKSFDVSSYQRFVIQHAMHFLQGLWAEGARRMLVLGLSPMGCLPIMMTLNSGNPILQRGCLDQYSAVARDYNKILQNELQLMQKSLASFGTRISYVDTYDLATKIIQEPQNYGIDEVSTGCCGTGYYELAFLCNPLSFACPDATKYMFFDSIHPTETAYYHLFNSIRPIIDCLLKD